MNLVDSRADRAQTALLEIANDHPEKTLSELVICSCRRITKCARRMLI